MKYSLRSQDSPSTLQIVAAILFAVLLVCAAAVVGLWLFNESFVYRGNGTGYN